jgi:hypothetical protein
MTALQPASSMDNNGGHARGLKPCPALAAAISELSIAIAFALSTLILLLREGSEWEWMGHVEPFLRYASMWALQRLLLVFRAQPTVTLHFGGAIHQQQRRVLSAHDARASAFGCFVPWRYLPLWTGSLSGLPLQPAFCKFLAAFRGFASSSNIRVFRRCRRREA